MMEGVEETLSAFKSSVRRSFDGASTKQAEETMDGAMQSWKESVRRRLMPTTENDVIEALELAQRLVDRPWYRAAVRANAVTVPDAPGLYAVGRRSRGHGSGSSSDSCPEESSCSSSGSSSCSSSGSSSGSSSCPEESSYSSASGGGRTSRRLSSSQGPAPSRHAQEIVYLQVACAPKDLRRSVRAAFSRKNPCGLSEALFSSAESDLYVKWTPFSHEWEAELPLSSCQAAVSQRLGYEPEYNEALYVHVDSCVVS
ncbi:uncharacterized protein LOC142905275 isoform X2 [Petromyzon marinus]|uniref:uncharacterized protein LOC142905275 isoform X2 n=1 Tax=Petromyzon marinus TaxID=7757 RepID=UPI003F6EDE8E